jgi:ribulose-bisphosphate carboxylase large chain
LVHLSRAAEADTSASVAGEVGGDLWKLTISYHEDSTGLELPQFLNVVFGNTSIKPRVQVADVRLSRGLREALPGPRYGSKGLRELCRVSEGEPLVMTALKPMGLSVEDLARQTYQFAKGGIDIIKDDHGLSNQRWAPWEERVKACVAAVKRANEETGRNCLYAPTLSGPIEKLFTMAKFAKKEGAGAVLMLPGITGFDSMRALAADPSFALPILCHPALLGCMLGGSLTPGSLHGFSHDVTLSLLPQISGADCTIFPNVGGRFGFTLKECQSIVMRCRCESGPYKPIAATPGGGMTLDRIPEILQVLGRDIILLVGGSVFARSPDLEDNSRAFVESTGRSVKSSSNQSIPSSSLTEQQQAANGNGSAPTEEQLEAIRMLRLRKYPSVQGNHGKFLEFKQGFSGSNKMGADDSSHWMNVALENYKPPGGDKPNFKGVSRTELIGRRDESPKFHVRYFEVSPGGYSSLEKHEHEHVVICIKGEGKCIVGQRIWEMNFGDVCYTSPWDVHQFSCPEEKKESFGFFCIVNAERDKPVLVDEHGLASTAPSSCG